ncbi:MAG: UDP-2,4-diacetamido-2,4,6-trideoxy-beta-L-altropyranose hydrolase [Desulfuromonadales bacterium C00003096]|nr:MAG: UDP-2,4-diacetamido-2,4,6-trideoxy-beta-L-altropyranose hydrolase [Desulfuromonadales bacterium C00003096]
MKIAFRVDASVHMGSGHISRCLTLAEALRERGAETEFICREHPGNLCDQIEACGHRVSRLFATDRKFHGDWNPHAPWLGVDRQQDAEETLAKLAAAGGQFDWLVVDHYAIDCEWESRLRTAVRQIAVIDDLADRPHDCDLLLDQNLYDEMKNRYDGLLPIRCRQLLGPKYALLRPEFTLERGCLRSRDGSVQRILVFFGGCDLGNETGKALGALRAAEFKDVIVDVVVGAGNPHRQEIESLCRGLSQVKFHCQVTNMAELMAAADLSLGAGGVTTWERCAMGLPGLVVAVARNQEGLAAYGAEKGLFFFLGASEVVTMERIREALRVFTRSPESLRAFSASGLAAVDGKGAQRLVGILMPPSIHLRGACLEDCDAILEWRNAEVTRRYIFDPQPISRNAHRAWLHKTLANPDRALLVGEIDGKPVGVLRYNLCGDEALISVYLVPGCEGQGVGSQLIRSGSLWLRKNQPHLKVVNAEIQSSNIASIRAFTWAGFQKHHVTYQEVLQ